MKTCPTCNESYPDNVDSCPQDGSRLAAEARDERECPYCAEKILKKARVCKHCGREVEPLAKSDAIAHLPFTEVSVGDSLELLATEAESLANGVRQDAGPLAAIWEQLSAKLTPLVKNLKEHGAEPGATALERFATASLPAAKWLRQQNAEELLAAIKVNAASIKDMFEQMAAQARICAKQLATMEVLARNAPSSAATEIAKMIVARPVTGSEKCLDDGTIELSSLNEEQFRAYHDAMQEWRKNEEACGRELSPKDRKAWDAIVEMVKWWDAFNKRLKEGSPCPPRPATVPMSQETEREDQEFDAALRGLEETVGSWMGNHSWAMEFGLELKNRQLDVVPYDGFTASQIKRDGAVYPYDGYHVSRIEFLEDGTPDVETLSRDVFHAYQKYMAGIVEERKLKGERLSPTDQRAWEAIQSVALNYWDKLEKQEADRKAKMREKEKSRVRGIIIAVAIACLVFLLLMAYR